MPGFSDIIFELRTGLDDPDDLHMRLREVLDPDLADRLAGFGAARGMALSETILRAVELFMLSAAEDAWRQMSGAERDASLGDPALRVILEQFFIHEPRSASAGPNRWSGTGNATESLPQNGLRGDFRCPDAGKSRKTPERRKSVDREAWRRLWPIRRQSNFFWLRKLHLSS